MAAQTGTLEKLKIQAYKDEKFSDTARDPYVVMINPENYSHTNKNEFSDTNAIGANENAPQFSKAGPEILSFKIVLDGTGVVPMPDNGAQKDVLQMIDDLKDSVYDFHGDDHQPYYSEILWGSLIFKGRLTDFSVEYKIFKPDGTPLRATVTLTFTQYTSKEEAAAEGKKNSPDLTHFIVIKEGDTLVELCRKIYGKSRFYLQVAEHNNLTNFRYLVPGSKLSFPPLK